MHPNIPLYYIIMLFFFTKTATPVIYTLSLHDALPISYTDLENLARRHDPDLDLETILDHLAGVSVFADEDFAEYGDRKSTRLNSSHMSISYAVFCLKKKKH